MKGKGRKIPKKIKKEFERLCEKENLNKKEKIKELEKLLNKYSYEPGEAIGIIAAQSISEPATQMSLDGEEKVIIKHNDNIKIVKMGEFADNIIERMGMEDNDWEVADLSDYDIFVPSITQNEKIEWKRVTACSRHKSPETLLEITTKSGRTIKATDSHSFVIRKHNKIVPVSGKKLSEGNRLPVTKFLPENCLDSLDVKNVLDYSAYKFKKKPLPERITLNEEWGWIIGAYLAEGNATKHYTSFSSTNEKFLKLLREFASKYSFSYNEYHNTRGFSLGHGIRINSTMLSRFLRRLCDTGSEMKHLPDFVYSANKKFISGLLKGYFDGNGNVTTNRNYIRVSSKSEELIDGIALLLNRFRIFANKYKSKKGNSLIISAKYAHPFKNKIGFNIKEKAEKLDELYCSGTTQEFTDMIEGFGNLFFRAAEKLNYPTRYINNFTKRQKIGRQTLLKYIIKFEKMAKEKNVDISREMKIMRRMFNSDVIWDEISSIERCKPAGDYVYDFTVEDTETFTTFDGIITHNTMRSYTLASQSDRLSKVTQGLPRLIEIFDARKTFERSMKIYLEKEYNNKDQAMKIADKIKNTKVVDLVEEDSINLIDMKIELVFRNKKDRNDSKKILTRYVKDADVKLKGNAIHVIPEDADIKELRDMLNKLLDYRVRGIKKIEQVVVVKEGEDWVIQTSGSDLKAVLKTEGVDIERTRTNDIYQTIKVLGVEAARNLIIEEAKKTLEQQGLEVDTRHLIILADMMTADGEIKAIGRYGVSGEKHSILARANFEETKKHLINASFEREIDTLESVVENVMIGQPVPVGTGMVSLGVDMEKMKKGMEK